MGYGSGYNSRTFRGGKSYTNEMTAHVWNAGSEERGQSNNGNLYFNGAAIFSYGSHFVLAYRMPDGVVFVNPDSHSITTSGHQSDVRAAIADRRTARVANLTDLAGDWKLLPRLSRYLRDAKPDKESRDAMRALVISTLVAHAESLSVEIYAAGASRYHWNATPCQRENVPGEIEAGAYLASLVGLPLATWTKAKRNAAKVEAKRKADKAVSDRRDAEERALRLSDMSAKDFRETLRRASDSYSDSKLRSTGKELKRARGLMLAAKSGKLAAASRLATIRDRIKMTAAYVDSYVVRHALRDKTAKERRHLSTVRDWRDCQNKAAALTSYGMRGLSDAGAWLAECGRTSAIRAAGATLNETAHAARLALESEAEREARRQAWIRNAERERAKAEWLAGSLARRGMSFDAESGGAALRIVGDTLETSHGAEVPLAHAVKVFRFIKLCRERGEAFHRNGRTIRVGHFQVDSISATGDFVAGCHNFTWEEVERVARIAGVFDCTSSEDAIESSAVAA